MGNPEIPHPRRPRTPLLNTALGALAALGDIFNEAHGATNAAIDVAFAALDFNERPFKCADIFHSLNTQYSAPKSAAGQGPKQAMKYYLDHGFVHELKTKPEYMRMRYMETGTRLVALAKGYNKLHLTLIQTCEGEDPTPENELLSIAWKTYAASHRIPTSGVTAERLAKQTGMHPETITHLGLIGFTGCTGIAASVKTLRGRWIKDTSESRPIGPTRGLIQPESGLQPVAPGQLVST